MEAAFQAARQLLACCCGALDCPVPVQISLRLREEEGLLLSALPRQIVRQAGDPVSLAQDLVSALETAGTPFSAPRAENGLLLLPLSPDWQRQVLDWYAALPWPETAVRSGLRRQDSGAPAFLRDYILRRCRALAARPGQAGTLPEPLPTGLICLLAQGPGQAPERWRLEIIRRYLRLSPSLRQAPPLAGAVGRAAGWCF